MTVVVTGAEGFLGQHLRLRLRALHPQTEVLSLHRWSTAAEVAAVVARADAVLHLAGVNRGTDREVLQGNVQAAESLVVALQGTGSSASVVYADSIQAGSSSPYGRGKAQAAQLLAAWGVQAGRPVADVLLPNLYGEHGRPGYHSFVATFAHQVAAGEQPAVEVDRPVPLLHVQDAAQTLLDAWHCNKHGMQEVRVTRTATVREVRDLLQSFAVTYCPDGSIPALVDRFEVTLFNTLRAALFPKQYPFRPQPHTDGRGTLVESVRVHGGQGQTFVSSTRPGQRRGDHFHLNKIERFQVLRGRGLIRLRRVLTDDYVEFLVDGAEPSVVDMPTGWAHSIENVGDAELLTLFWAHELFDADHSDTYCEVVRAPAAAAGAS